MTRSGTECNFQIHGFNSTHLNRPTLQVTARTVGFTEVLVFQTNLCNLRKKKWGILLLKSLPEADCPWQWWSPAAGPALGGSLSQLLFCSTSLTKSTQTTIMWLAHAPTGRWRDNHALLFPSHHAVVSENAAELPWRITRFYSKCQHPVTNWRAAEFQYHPPGMWSSLGVIQMATKSGN